MGHCLCTHGTLGGLCHIPGLAISWTQMRQDGKSRVNSRTHPPTQQVPDRSGRTEAPAATRPAPAGSMGGALGQHQLGAWGQYQPGAQGQHQLGALGQHQLGAQGQHQSRAWGQHQPQTQGEHGASTSWKHRVSISREHGASTGWEHEASKTLQGKLCGLTGWCSVPQSGCWATMPRGH